MKIDHSFYKFILIGSANTGINYAFYLFLLFCGVDYNLALLIDYIFGIALGFYFNKNYTFSNRLRHQGLFSRYLLTYGLIFALNLILLNALVLTDLFKPGLAQLIALIIVTLASFLIQKVWVFKGRDS